MRGKEQEQKRAVYKSDWSPQTGRQKKFEFVKAKSRSFSIHIGSSPGVDVEAMRQNLNFNSRKNNVHWPARQR